MTEYSIPTLIVKGVVFKSEQPLQLEEAVKLAREFESRGYAFHVYEKISDKRYERRSLSELEQALKKPS